MAAIWGAVIGLGAGLIGDAFSSSGTSQTNAQNEQINQENNTASWNRQIQAQTFNSAEANAQRVWAGDQVQKQEDFQTATQLQAEDYNTDMSNTAMQRRVADLKNAGLNPMLAVSEGGASTPTAQSLPGATGSGSAASIGAGGSPAQIAMQNPSAPYGNLGGQVSTAVQASQAAAQIDLLKAQTDNINAKTGTEIPANVAYLKSMTGLTDRNAEQAYYNTMNIQEQVYNQRLSNDQLRDVITPMQNQNLEVLKATRDALISAQQSDSTAKALGLQKLRNANAIESSQTGQIINWINTILQPVGTAAGAVRDLK